MEDITLGLFTKTRSSHARLNVPALVQVAAFAIILIRALDLLMILNLLGLQGLNEFIHRSVQTWNLTLVFLGSLALVFVEIWCAFSLVKGRNWARWIYLLTQIIAAGYDPFVFVSTNCAMTAVWGCAFGAFLRMKNKDEKGLALGYVISGRRLSPPATCGRRRWATGIRNCSAFPANPNGRSSTRW